MKRKEALNLLENNLQNKNLIKHCLAVEAVMRDLAEYFNEDKDEWGITGLLHDIDYEKVKGRLEEHSKTGAGMLHDLGFGDKICNAVFTHNGAHGVKPESLMAKALYCVDPLTGLIAASVLVLPSKKIKDLKIRNVLKRFKEKAFAKGANREIIKQSESLLGLSLEKFVEIALSGMQKIADDLGL